ncbi:MAG: choice-of-anchor E domain-containing protein [Verrucomicrobiota bacterium]
MKPIQTLLVLATLTGAASAATVTYYSDTKLAQNTDSNFNVAKFNSTLGTLTGVVVSVTSALQGTAIVTNNTTGTVGVSKFDTELAVRGQSSALGYGDDYSTIRRVSTSPAWSTVSIATLVAQSLVIQTGQYFSIAAQSIASEKFSAYESVGGTGAVTFIASDTHTITTTGNSYSVNSNTSGANTRFAVEYTYTAAIPETSSALLGGLGMLALLSRRRR